MTRRLNPCSSAGMALLLCLGTFGCGLQGHIDSDPVPTEVTDGKEFHGRLLEIANSYETYTRGFSDFRPALLACVFDPTNLNINQVPYQFSSSDHSPTHGQKLYSVFVKESLAKDGQPNPVGQVVVKEAWVPEEVDENTPLRPVVRKVKVQKGAKTEEREDAFVPYARHDGRLYHAASKSGLFIIFKLDPRTPGTDEGWVYGTVTADGKQVKSAGLVESCMGCHRDAPNDRLFGLAKRQ